MGGFDLGFHNLGVVDLCCVCELQELRQRGGGIWELEVA
jgi:hypothetical protein